jgi:hypothetical protein
MDKQTTAMLEQYTQCYEHLREHGRHLWYIPFGTATSAGVLVGAAFYYIPRHLWCVREAILLIAITLCFVFLVRMIKHTYFCRIWASTLHSIENSAQVKHIQLFTNPKIGISYWHSERPERFLENLSAHHAGIWGMGIILVLIAVIACIAPFIGS